MNIIEKLKDMKEELKKSLSSVIAPMDIKKTKTAWYIDEVFAVNGLWTQTSQTCRKISTTSNYTRKDDLRFVELVDDYYRDIFTGEQFDRVENTSLSFMNSRRIIHKDDIRSLMSIFANIDVCRRYTLEEYKEMYSMLMKEYHRYYEVQNASVSVCRVKDFEIDEIETPNRLNRFNRFNRFNRMGFDNNDSLKF